MSDALTGKACVAQDELGYLWVDGDLVPQFRLLNERQSNPGAVVMWTEQGLGLWVHPKSLSALRSVNTWDMEPDKWLPVNIAVADVPAFVTSAVSTGLDDREH